MLINGQTENTRRHHSTMVLPPRLVYYLDAQRCELFTAIGCCDECKSGDKRTNVWTPLLPVWASKLYIIVISLVIMIISWSGSFFCFCGPSLSHLFWARGEFSLVILIWVAFNIKIDQRNLNHIYVGHELKAQNSCRQSAVYFVVFARLVRLLFCLMSAKRDVSYT